MKFLFAFTREADLPGKQIMLGKLARFIVSHL